MGMIMMDTASATDLLNILQYLATENEGKIEDSIKSCGNIRMMIDHVQETIVNLQKENKGLKSKLKQQTKVKDKLMLEMKRNKQKMENISEMEKKIEKYEFVLNIEKYKQVQ